MNKYIRCLWPLSIVLGGIFMLGTALIDINNADIANLLVKNYLMLIVLSVSGAFFSLWLGYQLDKKKTLGSTFAILLLLLVVSASIIAFIVLHSEIPIYFAKLFIGFTVLFYGCSKMIALGFREGGGRG